MLRVTQFTLMVALVLTAACTESRRAPGLIEGMNPGECSDGADNDGDGAFDCMDSDCAGAPSCGDGSVPTDTGSRDTGTSLDSSAPPADTGTITDTGTPPPDSSGPPVCADASGTWEAVTDCPLLPMGELLTVSRIGECEFSISTSMASGTATVDGSAFTIMITTPVPVTCEGTYSGDRIITDCLGCMTELRRL